MIPYVDTIINMMNRNLMIFGSQTATCFHQKNAGFLGYTLFHFMDQWVKMSTTIGPEFNTSRYVGNEIQLLILILCKGYH